MDSNDVIKVPLYADGVPYGIMSYPVGDISDMSEEEQELYYILKEETENDNGRF